MCIFYKNKLINEFQRRNQVANYSSVNVFGLLVAGSAERRNGLVKESLISSSTSSVMVAENNIVCLLFGQRRTFNTKIRTIQPNTKK